MPYRRYGLILVFLMSAGQARQAGQAFCEEPISVDFLRGLNASIRQIDIFGNNMHEGRLLFPGAFYSKKYKTYAGLGFMIESAEILQKFEDYEEVEQILHRTDILMKIALYLRRKKTNLTLLFDYYRDKSWGISFKVRL